MPSGVGLVYLAVWALAGACRAGILRFHACVLTPISMRTVRMHPVALTASFLLFSLSMVGCKKSSSDPSPIPPGPNPTDSTCSLVAGLAGLGDTTLKITRDGQGRLSVVQFKFISTGFRSIRDTILQKDTYTYLSPQEIVVLSEFSAPNTLNVPQLYRIRNVYKMNGSKFVANVRRVLSPSDRVTKGIDSTIFQYTGETLSSMTRYLTVEKFTLNAVGTRIYKDTVITLKTIPNFRPDQSSMVVEQGLDSAGSFGVLWREAYGLESNTLTINPQNPYSLGPGLDIIPINQVIGAYSSQLFDLRAYNISGSLLPHLVGLEQNRVFRARGGSYYQISNRISSDGKRLELSSNSYFLANFYTYRCQ